MNKLRTVIRLHMDRVGTQSIAELSRTSRNTVKKHIAKWNSLNLSYEEFMAKSDADFHTLFCVEESPNVKIYNMQVYSEAFKLR